MRDWDFFLFPMHPSPALIAFIQLVWLSALHTIPYPNTMKEYVLFDHDARDRLLPLTYTRPACGLRIGILTIQEKWEHWTRQSIQSFITHDYLAGKYPAAFSDENVLINGTVLPSGPLFRLIDQMDANEAFLLNGEVIAARLDEDQVQRLLNDEEIEELAGYELTDSPFLKINHLWDIFSLNRQALAADFELLTFDRTSEPIAATNRVIAPENIFIEPGAKVEYATLNAADGPIYIGKDAEVMEGCMLRGPIAVCEGAVLKMGAKIYGATTIGPYCRVAGEVKNSVIMGYSNKGHEGYLGDSVIGEWCNLGADTNNSNMKNNYSEVRVWDYSTNGYVPTGLTFCGLVMGDHAKTGINTMFNTGTVAGVAANIFGSGYPPKFIPDFSWGGAEGFETFRLDKALEMAGEMMKRRGIEMDEIEKGILEDVFYQTMDYRK